MAACWPEVALTWDPARSHLPLLGYLSLSQAPQAVQPMTPEEKTKWNHACKALSPELDTK